MGLRKHRNEPITIFGKKFASQREGTRYLELLSKQKKGDISSLELQVKFELVPGVFLDGRKKPPVRYFADFVYTTTSGKKVAEDSKNPNLRKDPYYRLKKHLMKAIHNVEILET